MSDQRRKTVALAVRLDPQEADAIREKARDSGVTVSEFLRAAALGRKTRHSTNMDSAQIINELRRHGGLQKKIHNDTGGAYSGKTAEILMDIKLAIERIARGDLQGDS